MDGKLPVSQGHLFAANLGSPNFITIFDEIMEKHVTNAKLEKMLIAYKKSQTPALGCLSRGPALGCLSRGEIDI